MEEYDDERGSKNTKDLSSHSKGSNYEVEKDAKRFASSEKWATPLASLANKVLKRPNPISTPSLKAKAKVFTNLKCSIFLFEISLLFIEFFCSMPILNLPMQQDIEHLKYLQFSHYAFYWFLVPTFVSCVFKVLKAWFPFILLL